MSDRSERALTGMNFGMIMMLLVQLLLGMAVNLFVTITRHHPGVNASDFFVGLIQSVGWSIGHGSVPLVLHAVLGLLLLINGIVILLRSIRSHRTGLVVTSTIGALAILAAGFNGGSFLIYNQDVSSYIMTIGFALAVGSYALALFLLIPKHESRVSDGNAMGVR